MRSLAYAALVVSSLAVLAACDNGTSGTPLPVTPTTQGDTPTQDSATPGTTGQPLPYAGAPKVSNPLPASVLDGDPCTEALTPDQVRQALGKSIAGERNDSQSLGPYCAWANLDTGARIAVGYTTKVHTGLSGVYANTKPKTNTWKELAPIGGYPAVAYDISGDRCVITVGLADDVSIDVSGSVRDSKIGTTDPCEPTAKAAGTVVENMKKKAG